MRTYTSQEAKTTADWLRADASFDENEPSTRKGKLRAADLCEQLGDLLRAMDEAKHVAWRGRFLGGTDAGELGWILYDRKPKHSEESQRRWGLVISEPLFAHPPTDSAEAKDAKRWRCFVKGLRSRFPGAGHGKRIKVVDICPMYGDEGKSVDNIVEFIDAAMSAESHEGSHE